MEEMEKMDMMEKMEDKVALVLKVTRVI